MSLILVDLYPMWSWINGTLCLLVYSKIRVISGSCKDIGWTCSAQKQYIHYLTINWLFHLITVPPPLLSSTYSESCTLKNSMVIWSWNFRVILNISMLLSSSVILSASCIMAKSVATICSAIFVYFEKTAKTHGTSTTLEHGTSTTLFWLVRFIPLWHVPEQF